MVNTLKDIKYKISVFLVSPLHKFLRAFYQSNRSSNSSNWKVNVKIKVTFYNVCDFVYVVCAIDVFGFTHPKHIARATWGECNSLLPSIGEYTSITIVHEWNLYTKNVTRENVFNKENDWNLPTVQIKSETISLEVHELLYFQYLIE